MSNRNGREMVISHYQMKAGPICGIMYGNAQVLMCGEHMSKHILQETPNVGGSVGFRGPTTGTFSGIGKIILVRVS